MHQFYIKAKKIALQTLADCNITNLPVNLIDIADYYHIILVPYSISQYVKKYNLYNLDGFSFYRNGHHIIYFNDNIHRLKVRFTVAHELGHCLLGHTKQLKHSNVQEVAANIFAVNILSSHTIPNAIENTNYKA